jgi:CRP/FNR family transcriptional regulator, cyclic AMP receptor protein
MSHGRSNKSESRKPDLHGNDFLREITDGKSLLHFGKGETVFSEGEKADAIFFVRTGKIKVAVVSSAGREAVLSVAGPRDFFGEECLTAQVVRADTASALEPTTVCRIEKEAMQRALRESPSLSAKFTAALLLRNMRLKEDLCDQFFNHSERRLARVLVKLAHMTQDTAIHDVKLPFINHEILAEMVGTTRSRITHFMNKFREEGLIDYDGELTIRPELLTDTVLRD